MAHAFPLITDVLPRFYPQKEGATSFKVEVDTWLRVPASRSDLSTKEKRPIAGGISVNNKKTQRAALQGQVTLSVAGFTTQMDTTLLEGDNKVTIALDVHDVALWYVPVKLETKRTRHSQHQ